MRYRIFSAKEKAVIGVLEHDKQSQTVAIKLEEQYLQKYKKPIMLIVDNFITTSYPSAHSTDNLNISGAKDDFIKYLSQEFQIHLQIALLT